MMDPSHGKRVSLFGHGGRFIEMRNFDTPTAATSIVTDRGRMIGGRSVLRIIDAAGTRLGAGCAIDARYIKSGRTCGMIGSLTYGPVAARDGRIYCTQMISPKVWVIAAPSSRYA